MVWTILRLSISTGNLELTTWGSPTHSWLETQLRATSRLAARLAQETRAWFGQLVESTRRVSKRSWKWGRVYCLFAETPFGILELQSLASVGRIHRGI